MPRLVVAACAMGVAVCAMAAPQEIKVFTDELARHGEHTLETHANKARQEPLQVMPEYSYGVRPNWELSVQVPATLGERRRIDGYRAELQYVAPHSDEDGFYWGVNLEVARTVGAVWDVELIPIFGYRRDRWHFAANPAIGKAVSGASPATHLDPAAKVAYQAFARNAFGLEYYVEAGPLRHRLAREEQSRVLYFVWDGKVGKSVLNLGIGRGTTDASDRWVVKAICEFAF